MRPSFLVRWWACTDGRPKRRVMQPRRPRALARCRHDPSCAPRPTACSIAAPARFASAPRSSNQATMAVCPQRAANPSGVERYSSSTASISAPCSSNRRAFVEIAGLRHVVQQRHALPRLVPGAHAALEQQLRDVRVLEVVEPAPLRQVGHLRAAAQQQLEHAKVALLRRHHEHAFGPRRQFVGGEIGPCGQQPVHLTQLALVQRAIEASLLGVLPVVDVAGLAPRLRELRITRRVLEDTHYLVVLAIARHRQQVVAERIALVARVERPGSHELFDQRHVPLAYRKV